MATPSLQPTRDPTGYAASRTSMRLTSLPHSHARRGRLTRDDGHFREGTIVAADAAVKQERSRVASDLHDTVAQTLYGISLSAARVLLLIERNQTAQLQGVVEDLLHLANDGQTELRTLLHDLRSDEMQQFEEGLIGALTALATGLETRTGCRVRLAIGDEAEIAPATKAILVRIAREALNNIAKHARATRVDVVLEVQSEEAVLVVTDDGDGFDPSAAHLGHFGLHMMREHALAVGGGLEVVSAPGRGTQIRVRVASRPR
jgi:signal transduction histidine kinase